MDTLALLLAEKQCRDVVLTTAQLADDQDYAGLVALFTPDATLVRPGGEPLAGRDAILASYASKSTARLTQHLLCNHFIRVTDAASAESRCKVILYVSDRKYELAPKGRPAGPIHQVGQIIDRLELTVQGWRIKERRAWFDLSVEAPRP